MTKPTPEDRERALKWARSEIADPELADDSAALVPPRVLLALHAELAESERARGVLRTALLTIEQDNGMVLHPATVAQEALAADREETTVKPDPDACYCSEYQSSGCPCLPGKCPNVPQAERPPEAAEPSDDWLRSEYLRVSGGSAVIENHVDGLRALYNAGRASEAAAHEETKQELAELRVLYNANALKRENARLLDRARAYWDELGGCAKRELLGVRPRVPTVEQVGKLLIEVTAEPANITDAAERFVALFTGPAVDRKDSGPEGQKEGANETIRAATGRAVLTAIANPGAFGSPVLGDAHRPGAGRSEAGGPAEQRHVARAGCANEVPADAQVQRIEVSPPETEAPSPLPEVLPAGTRAVLSDGREVVAATECRLRPPAVSDYLVYWASWDKLDREQTYVRHERIDWADYRAQQAKAEEPPWNYDAPPDSEIGQVHEVEYIPRGSCNTSLWYEVYYLGEKRWAWSRNDSRSKLVPNVHRWRRAATPAPTLESLDARLREVERRLQPAPKYIAHTCRNYPDIACDGCAADRRGG